MPQKKIRKSPIILLASLSLVLLVCACFVWTVFGSAAASLAAAADVSLSQIEYITVRYEDENGNSQVKKITSEEEIERLYASLSNMHVKKRVRFGLEASQAHSSISLKLKDKSGTVRISDSSNHFAAQNKGLLSAFFICYYDVENPKEFLDTVSDFAA